MNIDQLNELTKRVTAESRRVDDLQDKFRQANNVADAMNNLRELTMRNNVYVSIVSDVGDKANVHIDSDQWPVLQGALLTVLTVQHERLMMALDKLDENGLEVDVNEGE